MIEKKVKILSLTKVLEYKNEDVIDSFCRSFDIDRDEAEDIFQQCLTFLWMSAMSKDESIGKIDTPLLIIDEMWHTFILFTKHYEYFCMRHFGKFINHCPTTEKEVDELKKKDSEQILKESRDRYEFVYNTLGEETFRKWFLIYPECYTEKKIRELRKK